MGGDDLPRDLVKSGVPISGLYDLEPLRRTTINDAVGLDAHTAREFSPLLLSPAADAPVLAVVGGGETDAFHDQTERFAARWTQLSAQVETLIEPGVDHFDIVNRLADPDSEVCRAVLGLLR